MYQFLKGLKANYILSAIFCILFGITLVVWPDVSSRIVCIGLGAVLALSGIVNLITFFIQRDGRLISQINLLVGILLTVLGGWIMCSPEVVIKIIPIIIGVVVTIHGLHNLLQAWELFRNKYSKYWVALLLGVVTVGLGILLICNPFEAVNTAVTLIGIFLIYDGASDIWIVSRVSKTAREVKETMDALDVEAKMDD